MAREMSHLRYTSALPRLFRYRTLRQAVPGLPQEGPLFATGPLGRVIFIKLPKAPEPQALSQRVLVVDGRPERADAVRNALNGRYLAQAVSCRNDALVAVYDAAWSAAVVAHDLPGASGLEVLHHLRTTTPGTFRVAHTDSPEPHVRYDLARFGDPHALLSRDAGPLHEQVVRTLDELFAPGVVSDADRNEPLTALGAWTAQSPAARAFLERLKAAAHSDAPVYLYGEIASGTEAAGVLLRQWRNAWRGGAPRRRSEDPVVVLRVPSLRERLQDIPTLAQRCLAEHARMTGEPEKVLDPAALDELLGRNWGGNVIELRSVLVHACHTAGRRQELHAADLPGGRDQAWPLTRVARQEGQRDCVLRQLCARRHVTRAAQADGSARANYIRLMRRLGIVRADLHMRLPGEGHAAPR